MKKILLVVVIIVLLSLGLYIGMSVVKKNNFEVTNETEEDEVEKWFRENREKEEEFNKKYYISEEDIYEIAKSSPDWEKVDIAEDKKEILMKKYPNGILGGNDYDDMYIEEGYQNLISTMDGPLEFHIIATKGLKKDRYKIDGTGFGNFFAKNNFEIYEIVKFEITDENGNKVNSGLPMDKKHWMQNMLLLCKSDDKEVGRSERFNREHPNFAGLLNPYNEEIRDIEINEIVDQCNFEKKEYVCEVYYHHRYLYVTYKISFTVDDNNYIDTVNIEELSSREKEWNDYGKLLDSTGFAIKILLKNRSMDKVPISSKLVEKLNNNLIDYDIIWFRRIKYEKGQNNNQNLYRVVLTNNETKYIGLKYKIVNNKIDDIIVTELPITEEAFENYTTEELYDMF